MYPRRKAESFAQMKTLRKQIFEQNFEKYFYFSSEQIYSLIANLCGLLFYQICSVIVVSIFLDKFRACNKNRKSILQENKLSAK